MDNPSECCKIKCTRDTSCFGEIIERQKTLLLGQLFGWAAAAMGILNAQSCDRIAVLDDVVSVTHDNNIYENVDEE